MIQLLTQLLYLFSFILDACTLVFSPKRKEPTITISNENGPAQALELK